MKKSLSCLILLLYCISGYAQYKFRLDVKSKTLSDKKIFIRIFNNQNYNPVKVDSFLIKNGDHILYGEVKQPSNFAAFVVKYKGKFIDRNFVLDSGVNKISLDLPIGDSRYLTLHSDARGNVIFDDLNNLFLATAASYKKQTSINGYLNISTDLNELIKKVQLARLETYPNDFGSLIYLYRISRMDANPTYAKANLATLERFSDELKNSVLGRQLYTDETDLIKNKITAASGNTVKIFSVTDINNQAFSNSSLKGQPYVIIFSATWCGPCQLQLPGLKKLYDKYKGKGLKVIYFNDDDDRIRWQNHVSKNKLTWINVSENLSPSISKIPKSFGIYSIPACFVVDKKGVIIYNSDETDRGLEHIESYIKKSINN